MNFSEFDREPSGKVNLIGRVKYVFDYLTLFFFSVCLSLVLGVILMWANDIILNFLSKSFLTDILEKEVLIRKMWNISLPTIFLPCFLKCSSIHYISVRGT